MSGLIPFNRRNRLARAGDYYADPANLIESFFNNAFTPMRYTHNVLKVDIRETENAYLLEADLPGVTKDQIVLDIQDETLTIRVNRDEQTEQKEENYICRERRSSTIARSFGLGGVDADKISAKLADGVLTLTLPKSGEEQPKRRSVDIE